MYHSHLVTAFLKYTFQATEVLIPIVSLSILGILIYDLGVNPIFAHSVYTHQMLLPAFDSLGVIMVARFLSEWYEKKKISAHAFSFFLVVLTFYLSHLLNALSQTEPLRSNDFLVKKIILYGGIVFIFLTEASKVLRFVYRKSVNPSFLFIVSFALIILAGALLLMLPLMESLQSMPSLLQPVPYVSLGSLWWIQRPRSLL
jgi:hypothetical protein